MTTAGVLGWDRTRRSGAEAQGRRAARASRAKAGTAFDRLCLALYGPGECDRWGVRAPARQAPPAPVVVAFREASEAVRREVARLAYANPDRSLGAEEIAAAVGLPSPAAGTGRAA